ncbi:hypothetical protein [Silvimonas amylolytica]|uniref:Uncharacterized protein n=1 Tax=Silvimonas amylolytica TaxID=449663 RepID=A0ABQ2PFK5_9NEIS|nr:hypothetical protein [Silvimonas amylolytica]GGP24357.1 hypothetical protein GCM10010971_01760 [Silvimonas amylolytica]
MKKAIITACTIAAALVAGSAMAGATGEHPYRNGVLDNSPAFYKHMQDGTTNNNMGLTQPTATGTDSSSSMDSSSSTN